MQGAMGFVIIRGDTRSPGDIINGLDVCFDLNPEGLARETPMA